MSEFLLGSKSTFKFFLWATVGYKKYLQFQVNRREDSDISKPILNIKFGGSRNKKFTRLMEGREFTINEKLLKEKENFFTISKHPLADFQLPAEDINLSCITACLFFKENHYYVMDLSNKRFFVSRKMIPIKEYELEENMVIDLATRHMISINKIINDNAKNQSSIEWEFIKGDYSNPLGESRINTLRSEDYLKCSAISNERERIFIFGRQGTEDSCFRFSDPSISKMHLYFKYVLATHKWTIYEKDAKHGNFLLFKNRGEIFEKKISGPQKLCNNVPNEVVFFEGYFAFIEYVKTA